MAKKRNYRLNIGLIVNIKFHAIALGGKPSIQAAIAVKSGNIIKNMSTVPATICGLLVDAVRPDSYSSEESNFWSDLEDWFEIGLTGLAMEYFF